MKLIKHIIEEYKDVMSGFLNNLNMFIKYEILTKGVLVLIIIPIFTFLSRIVINSSGENSIENLKVLDFLFTPNGIAFSLLFMAIIVSEIIIEIGGYITISSKIICGKKEASFFDILKYNLRILPKMFCTGGLVIIIYLILLVPLSGLGYHLTFLKNIGLPDFVKEAIDKKDTLFILYDIFIVILTYFSFKIIFTFHFMLIYEMKAKNAIKSSWNLVRKNWKSFLIDLVSIALFNFIIFSLLLALWLFFIQIMAHNLDLDNAGSRIFMSMLLVLQNIGILIVTVLIVPFETFHFTKAFYKFYDKELAVYPDLPEKKKQSLFDKVFNKKRNLILGISIFTILIAIPMGILTKDLFGINPNIIVMSHRGYGEGYPENSISAIEKSIREKLDYVEIDVQRTKDGYIILNHDFNLKRVASNNLDYLDKNIDALTFEQVRKVDIGSRYGVKYKGEKIPTLEDVLKVAKGKIKVNIEIKNTGDSETLVSVMDLVDKMGMKKQVMITSMDYNDLKYIEDNDKEFITGLIYYINLDNHKNLKVDYMIIEKSLADDHTIEKIHSSGKKVIVWTVNKNDEIERLIKKDVDGIISDKPNEAKKIIIDVSRLSEKDLIISSFFDDIMDGKH